eukprot:1453992-Prymnesium_polylepis.1
MLAPLREVVADRQKIRIRDTEDAREEIALRFDFRSSADASQIGEVLYDVPPPRRICEVHEEPMVAIVGVQIRRIARVRQGRRVDSFQIPMLDDAVPATSGAEEALRDRGRLPTDLANCSDIMGVRHR